MFLWHCYNFRPGRHTVEGNHIHFDSEDRKISQKHCGSRPGSSFTDRTDRRASGDGLWGDVAPTPGIPVAFLAGFIEIPYIVNIWYNTGGHCFCEEATPKIYLYNSDLNMLKTWTLKNNGFVGEIVSRRFRSKREAFKRFLSNYHLPTCFFAFPLKIDQLKVNRVETKQHLTGCSTLYLKNKVFHHSTSTSKLVP